MTVNDAAAASQQTADGSGSVFARVAQELLDSAERVTTTLEHGMQVFFSGQQASSDTVPPEQFMDEEASFQDNVEFSQLDYETMIREQVEGSPLEGMAEQVLGGIMKGQVCMM